MRAYARVLPPGPAAQAICEACEWIEPHPRQQEALAAVRAHNRDRHAYPEQTLGFDTEDATDDR